MVLRVGAGWSQASRWGLVVEAVLQGVGGLAAIRVPASARGVVAEVRGRAGAGCRVQQVGRLAALGLPVG